MQFPKFRTPLQKEWDKLIKQENALLAKKAEKKPTKLSVLLENKVPQNLQNTLNNAFEKAFATVFTKGTVVIEKTYNREKASHQAFVSHTMASRAKPRRAELKNVNKNATKSSAANLAASTVTGVGLGVLGIGIPDIVLFVSFVLKNMYQIATGYQLDYRTERERKFILLVIQGALAGGENQRVINTAIDFYIQNGYFADDKPLEEYIKDCSASLAGELLYMKFLQGIPVVGAVGGVYDFVYMKQINSYARIKYYKRYLSNRIGQ